MRPSLRNTISKTILKSGGLLLTALLLGINLALVHAQDGTVLRIQSLQSDAFPRMQFTFEAYDREGGFKLDIPISDVFVAENGSERELTKLVVDEPGLQMLFAINGSPELSALADGESYFEKIKTGMLLWAKTQTSNELDDYSLVDNTGLRVIRSKDIQYWSQTVAEYSPDLLLSRQSLAALNMALDMGLETNPRPNMKRSILYISPPPLVEHGQALPNLTDRALRQGIEINVWLVPSITQNYPQGIEMLRSMAEATGGHFVQISPQEELPDIENYFQNLHYIYTAEYISGITRSGNQSITLKIDTQDYQANSPAFPFKLDVSPPNPIFLSPPARIERSWVGIKQGGAETLQPAREPIQILVEFQDGFPRDLLKTTLYVNDEKAAENLSQPFDRFDWDIENIIESGIFQLQIEAVDTLGLSQRSIKQPVEVVVETKPPTIMERILSQGALPIVIAITFAGVIGLSIFLLVRGKPLQTRRKIVQKRLDQTANPNSEEQNKEGSEDKEGFKQSPSWPSTRSSSTAPARLAAIEEDGSPSKEGFIVINRKEITFGSDPKQATHVLRSKTVSGLHARMTRLPGEAFILADAGSTAGTWVNLAPVLSSGRLLKHGDMIHIGEFAFRFELRNPPASPGIKVYPIKKGELW